MSASNSDLQSDIQDALTTSLESGAEEYSIGGRRVRRHSMKDLLDAMNRLQGLTSDKRGLSVAQIDRAG